MLTYVFVVFCVYFGILSYVLTVQWLTFDLYERKFRLLPYWFKFIALTWLLISIVLLFVFKDTLPKWNELLLSNFNISLFIFFFSKQKEEDEFSEQIRFKAFAYSFVSIIALFGVIGALNIVDADSSWTNFLVHGYLGAGLLVATLYFYFTVYKLRKENS